MEDELEDRISFIYWFKDKYGYTPDKGWWEDPDPLYVGYVGGAQGMRNLNKALQAQNDHWEKMFEQLRKDLGDDYKFPFP